MVTFANNPNWSLHDNGISVVNTQGEQIIDLHNDCVVTYTDQTETTLEVHMLKNLDYTHSPASKIGDHIILVISNLGGCDRIEDLNYPALFEGIYNVTADSLDLLLGDEKGYPVRGKKLELRLEIEHS